MDTFYQKQQMSFRPRHGNIVSHYIINHDSLSHPTRKPTKLKQHRVLRPVISEQIPVQPEPFHHNEPAPATQDHEFSVTDSSENETDDDSSSTRSSVSSTRSDDWYNFGPATDDDIIQAQLDSIRLEDQLQDALPDPCLDEYQWTEPTFTETKESKKWKERENWKRNFTDIREELIRFMYGQSHQCKADNCANEGLWKCLDCDIGK